MHCFKRCTLALLAACLIVAIAVVVWARSLHGLLASPDPLRKADAIVVLGGDVSRVITGADLYREGLAPRVLLSYPRREERFEELEREGIAYPWFEVAGKELMRLRGIPDEAVGVFGDRLTSTVAEARTIGERYPQLKSILLVTSPYHVYRARMIFREQLPGVEIIGVSARHEKFDPDWWHDPEMMRHAIMESLKLAFYLAGGRR